MNNTCDEQRPEQMFSFWCTVLSVNQNTAKVDILYTVMGQQQLILTVLGTIIVGIAIAVAITLYDDHMIEANRDDIQRDLVEISGKAMKYYFSSRTVGGGGHSFVGLTADAAGMAKLVTPAFADNEHGTYTISTAGDGALVIIQGVGKVQLPDGTYPMYVSRVRARKFLLQLVN
jgi:hypothetical protein